MGGNFLPKLNIGSRPIAHKYREGKMKSTLERGLKVSEVAKGEASVTSCLSIDCSLTYGACLTLSNEGVRKHDLLGLESASIDMSPVRDV